MERSPSWRCPSEIGLDFGCLGPEVRGAKTPHADILLLDLVSAKVFLVMQAWCSPRGDDVIGSTCVYPFGRDAMTSDCACLSLSTAICAAFAAAASRSVNSFDFVL